MTNFLRTTSILITFLFFFLPNHLNAQVCSDTQYEGTTDIGGGQFELEFTVCFPAPAGVVASSGIVIVIGGVTIVSANPPILSNSSNANTINSNITGGTIAYGDFSNPFGSPFLLNGDGGECMTIFITVDGIPTSWQIYGQNFNSLSNLYECDVRGEICLADAGTPTISQVDVCPNDPDITLETIGVIDAVGADPCIIWGVWLISDPLEAYGPAGSVNCMGCVPTVASIYSGTENLVDLLSSGTAGGNNPLSQTPLANGATVYIAPITATDCATAGGNPDCTSVGAPTEVYFIEAITANTPVIDCFDQTASTTFMEFNVFGGDAAANGTTLSISNNGDGNLVSSGTINSGDIVRFEDIPDGGTVMITVTDDFGCTEDFTFGPVNAADHCTGCVADAGDVILTQGGTGNTQTNNGQNATGPFILCWNDQMDFTSVGNSTNSIDALCGPPDCNGTCNGGGFIWNTHWAPPNSGDPLDPATSANWGYGGFSNGNFDVVNNNSHFNTIVGQLTAGSSAPFVNNTVYYIVSTFDWSCTTTGGSFYDVDFDGNGCFDIGVPVEVTYLNRMSQNTIQEDCNGIVMEFSGGSPEFFADNYNLTNTGDGVLSQLSVQFGQSVTIGGLANGDTWSIDVIDGNGCPESFSGTFNGIPDIDFSMQTTFCAQDGAIPLSGSPSTPSSSFSGPGVDNSGGTPMFDPQLIGVGTHTITYNYGECGLTATQDVTVNPAPSAVLYGGGDGCAGNPADIFIDITGGVGPYEVTYKIDGVEQPIITLNGPSPVSTTIPPTIQGTYTLCLIDDLGSALCDGTGGGEAQIVLEPLPMVNNNIYIYSCVDSEEFNLTETPCDDPTICGFSGEIDLDGGNDIVFWEDWDFTVDPGMVGGTIDITNESNYSPPGGCGSIIYAQVINPSTNCFTIATVTLHCINPPEITFPTSQIMLNCGDDLDIEVTFDSTNISFANWTSDIPDGMGGVTTGPSAFGTNIVQNDLSVEGTYTYTMIVLDGIIETCTNEFEIEVVVTGCSMGCIDWDDTPIESCGLTHIETLTTNALGGDWVTVDSPAGSTAAFSEVGTDALITVSDCGEYAFEYTINNATCQDLDTLYVNFENNTVVNLEITSTATLEFCPVDCHPDPTPENCPDNMLTLTSPSGAPEAIWNVTNEGSCDGVQTAGSSGGGKQSTFFDGTTFDDTAFLDMFDLGGILGDLMLACPVEASCFSANNLDDCIIESTTTTETLEIPVLLGGAWTIDDGSGTYIPFDASNQALVTYGGITYQINASPSSDTWSPVDFTAFQMIGGIPSPIIDGFSNPQLFLWEAEWGTEEVTRTVTEYEIDPTCTGCPNGYTITVNGPTIPSPPSGPCGPVGGGFGGGTMICDDNDCNTIDTWDDTLCECVYMPDPNLPLLCDDGDCTNGEEIYNSLTCDCDVVPVTTGCTDMNACNFDPLATCDDGSCVPNTDPGICNTDCTMGDLEIWDTANCQCVLDQVVVSGCTDANSCNFNPAANCDDGSCVPNTDPGTCNTDCTMGDLEIWDAANCQCVVDQVVVAGCTDTNSCNFNPSANCDDGSCIPNTDPGICNTDCTMGDLEIWDAANCQCVVDQVVVAGCTDNNSCNFNPAANCDDGSCIPLPICNTDPCIGDVEIVDPTNPCNCIVDEVQVLGCINPASCNYNPNANCDDGSCIPTPICNTDPCTGDIEIIDPTNPCNCITQTPQELGCTNATACNYNPNANCDDGSCLPTPTCNNDPCLGDVEIIDPTNPCNCIVDTPQVLGCTDANACNFNTNANCDDGSCIIMTTCDSDPCTNGGTYIWDTNSCLCVLDQATINGCTNPSAPNYDPTANCDDGSCDCIPDGCIDPTACNYDPNATCPDGSCIFETACDTDACTNGGIYTWDTNLCDCVLDEATINGCTNPASCNYDPAANCDDGSCLPTPTCNIDPCAGDIETIDPTDPCNCIVDTPQALGCTDPAACNFDPNANCADGSCIFETACDLDPCTNGGTYIWDATTCSCVIDEPTVIGCTDVNSPSYNPNANCSDPTACDCTPDGCTDVTACNFDPTATCPDGSCIYETACDLDFCTNGGTYAWDPISCTCVLDVVTALGCTDPTACNFNPTANCDDNSCIPNTDPGTCNTDCAMGDLEIWDANNCQCVVDVVVVNGCTDPNSCNYNPAANCDDGSCIPNTDPGTCNTDFLMGDLEIWDTNSCQCIVDVVVIQGCTDPNSANYDPNANC